MVLLRVYVVVVTRAIYTGPKYPPCRTTRVRRLWQDKSSDSNGRIGNEEKTPPCIPLNYESRLILAMINAMSATNEPGNGGIFHSIEHRTFPSRNEIVF